MILDVWMRHPSARLLSHELFAWWRDHPLDAECVEPEQALRVATAGFAQRVRRARRVGAQPLAA